MSFFKKLKDRLFKSSSKIDEGLEAIVQEAADEANRDHQYLLLFARFVAHLLLIFFCAVVC